MFDLDAGKLIIIGIVALVVIGPKELPRVMRQVGQAIGKLRRMAADFQGQFMDAMKEADIEDLKKEINAVADSAKAEVNAISEAARIEVNFDPVSEIKDDVTKAIDAEGAAQTNAAAALAPALDLALNLPAVPDVPAVAIAAPEGEKPKRKPRAKKAVEEVFQPANLDVLAPASAAAAPDDAEARERVPFRKRVAYESGRAARARRDAT